MAAVNEPSTLSPPLSDSQGRWYDDNSLLMLPHVTDAAAAQLAAAGLGHLPQLLQALAAGGQARAAAVAAVEGTVGQGEARDVLAVLERLPVVGVRWQAPKLVPHNGSGPSGGSAGNGSGGNAGASYCLEVELQRLAGKGGSRQAPPRVYAPQFPKVSGGGAGRGSPLAAAGAASAASAAPEALVGHADQMPRIRPLAPAPATHVLHPPPTPPHPPCQVKEEGWWLVAGDAASGDLYAIKRVSFGQRTTTR